NAFRSVRKELYELFSTMQFSNTTITSETVKMISEDYSVAESDILELYRRYMLVINDIIAISNGQTPSGEVTNIVGSLTIDTQKPLHTYQEKKKSVIQESIAAV